MKARTEQRSERCAKTIDTQQHPCHQGTVLAGNKNSTSSPVCKAQSVCLIGSSIFFLHPQTCIHHVYYDIATELLSPLPRPFDSRNNFPRSSIGPPSFFCADEAQPGNHWKNFLLPLTPPPIPDHATPNKPRSTTKNESLPRILNSVDLAGKTREGFFS